MRLALLHLLLALPMAAGAQAHSPAGQALAFTDAIALQRSKAQVLELALKAWTYTFGQEPGAAMLQVDSTNGRIEGSARVNFRSTALGAREATLGVIAYRISLEARNGQCLVRITQLEHTGNRNAPGGGINMGTIYAGQRPPGPVRGISQGSVQRLHDDMRGQASEKIQGAMPAFAARLRLLAQP